MNKIKKLKIKLENQIRKSMNNVTIFIDNKCHETRMSLRKEHRNVTFLNLSNIKNQIDNQICINLARIDLNVKKW